MQFVKNGPDIPQELLEAHEDERVVFFCGTGVAAPAGLPGFASPVDQLYERMRIDPSRVQARAIKAGQYDTAVGVVFRRNALPSLTLCPRSIG